MKLLFVENCYLRALKSYCMTRYLWYEEDEENLLMQLCQNLFLKSFDLHYGQHVYNEMYGKCISVWYKI